MGARMLLAPVWTLLAAPAWAAPCATPYTLDNVLGELTAIEAHLRAGEDPEAAAASGRLEAGMACMGEVLPVMIVGRTYRAIGAGKVAGGDSDGGVRWFRTATEFEQSFSYGLEDLPEGHAVREVYENTKASASGEVVLMEEMIFADGNHYIDGRKISTPKARLDRPHVYQLEGGGEVYSWVIEGNGFPPDVLKTQIVVAEAEVPEPVKAAKAAKPPKAEKPEKPPKPAKDKPVKDDAVADASDAKPEKPEKVTKAPKVKSTTTADGSMVIQRARPKEKTPLMIGGGAIIAGAGGIYFASMQSRRAFDNGTTVAEIEQLQTQTNQLVLASAAVMAVGTGTLTWGVILDGGAPAPAFRFRF